MNLKEFFQEESYLWTYGVCPTDLCVDEVSFQSDGDGEPMTEEKCPECGAPLEIKHRLKMSIELEDVPSEIREKVDLIQKAEGQGDLGEFE